jgi:hypothetical protein
MRFVSEHRFGLPVAACILALVLMTGAIYATTGFDLTSNASLGPGIGPFIERLPLASGQFPMGAGA